MRLSTYPRLNLPTKRLGLLVTDWFWVGGMVVPGLLFESMVLSLLLPLLGFLYARGVKSKKPDGWTGARAKYYLSPKMALAGLEKNAHGNIFTDQPARR